MYKTVNIGKVLSLFLGDDKRCFIWLKDSIDITENKLFGSSHKTWEILLGNLNSNRLA